MRDNNSVQAILHEPYSCSLLVQMNLHSLMLAHHVCHFTTLVELDQHLRRTSFVINCESKVTCMSHVTGSLLILMKATPHVDRLRNLWEPVQSHALTGNAFGNQQNLGTQVTSATELHALT